MDNETKYSQHIEKKINIFFYSSLALFVILLIVVAPLIYRIKAPDIRYYIWKTNFGQPARIYHYFKSNDYEVRVTEGPNLVYDRSETVTVTEEQRITMEVTNLDGETITHQWILYTPNQTSLRFPENEIEIKEDTSVQSIYYSNAERPIPIPVSFGSNNHPDPDQGIETEEVQSYRVFDYTQQCDTSSTFPYITKLLPLSPESLQIQKDLNIPYPSNEIIEYMFGAQYID